MVILVTGTSSGIGRALAEHLARRGDTVIGCSRRDVAAAPGGSHFQVDLTAADQVRAMFRTIRSEHGRLDAVVNNAGTAAMAPFLLTPDREIARLFEINVFATLRCSREAVKLLRRSEHPAPSILNISTVAVPWSIPGQLAYAASKSAVEQTTRTLSHELGEFNIRVNALGLPPVRTALTRTVDPAKIAALTTRQAIRRPCTMEDVTGPVDFLLSAAARFVTGETLFLGGIH